MRCHYLSDLHFERQDPALRLPGGDILIIAGDLCNAACLDPATRRPYDVAQRERVLRFLDVVRRGFRHVVLVPGNHEFHDGALETTVDLLRRHLPGVTVLDNTTCEIDGIRFFGSTLWTDCGGGSDGAAMDALRRGVGDFFFIKCHDATARRSRFQPETAVAAHRRSLAALQTVLADGRPTVVVTHHAPSAAGLNKRHKGNGLDALYASDLEAFIRAHDNITAWVHGHTHVATRYAISATPIYSNAFGIAAQGRASPGFSPQACFDVR